MISNPSWQFDLQWRADRVAWVLVLIRTDPDGTQHLVDLTPREESVKRHGFVGDDHCLFWEDETLRPLLQQIVNQAYRQMNIIPAGWGEHNTAQAKHLEDMKNITQQLLDKVAPRK